jgi:hypothetical protein
MSRITPAEAWDAITPMLVRLRDPATREAYLAFHTKHRDLALTVPASVRKHHAFPGGYPIHIREVMSNLRELVANPAIMMGMEFTSGFGPDDAITASYMHDVDKLLYRYELDNEKPTGPQLDLARRLGIPPSATETKETISLRIDAAKRGEKLDERDLPRHRYREGALEFEDGAIVCKLAWEHGLPLSHMALHAICVHHGGFSPLARTMHHLQMQPLGVLLHTADLMSAAFQFGEGEWKPGSAAAVPPPQSATSLDSEAPPPPPED